MKNDFYSLVIVLRGSAKRSFLYLRLNSLGKFMFDKGLLNDLNLLGYCRGILNEGLISDVFTEYQLRQLKKHLLGRVIVCVYTSEFNPDDVSPRFLSKGFMCL